MQAVDLSQDIGLALEYGLRLTYIDEFVITKKTLQTHACSLKRTNILLDIHKTNINCHAVVLAVSRENGVEYVDVYEKSINMIKFKNFLDNLKTKYSEDRVCLVMDNLNIHRSLEA